MSADFRSKWLPSFARRRGRSVSDLQQQLLKELLPSITLVENHSFAPERLAPLPQSLWIEIGFGGGEHLAHQAKLHPEITCIGCETYWNGVACLLQHIHEQQIPNIRIFHEDARALLEALPDHSIDRLFVLFPDPWRKRVHYKRRIISDAALQLFAQKLKHGGILQLATDHADYAEWMQDHLTRSPQFTPNDPSYDGLTPPENWIPTRYEQKARRAGITNIRYFVYRNC